MVQIDPRPYEAALTQAQGQLLRDKATLENARIDLKRYQVLVPQKAVPEQQLATQQATVSQDEGNVKYDEGVVAAAQTNVEYTKIAAPSQAWWVCGWWIPATLCRPAIPTACW